MNLKEQISVDIKAAMKSKNTGKLSILRVLKGEIERGEQSSAGKVELSDAEIIKIIKKMVDGISTTTKNASELKVLNEYLPSQLSEANIRNIISDIQELGIKNIGEIMQYFSRNYAGRYDGKLVSSLAKEVYA